MSGLTSLLNLYLDCTHSRSAQWVTLPDYLEQRNDTLLQNFLMLHDPYLYEDKQLSAERSWRLELDGKVVFLLCGTTYDGAHIYRLGLQLQEEIAVLTPETEEEQALLDKLTALVEAQQSAAEGAVTKQASSAQQKKHCHEAELEPAALC